MLDGNGRNRQACSQVRELSRLLAALVLELFALDRIVLHQLNLRI